jgi:hypothetical protein
MRRLLAPTLLAATIVSAAAAAPPIGVTADSATVAATPSTAAARPSALLLKLHYGMLCAQPGRGPVTVMFPRALRLPAHLPRSAVLVDGANPPSVELHGRVATIGLPPVSGVICQSFVPGTLRVGFTRSAHIGNPVQAGTYEVHAAIGTHTFVARLRIRR